MALSGLHVACGFVNIAEGIGLFGLLQWAQTMSVPGTTSKSVPNFKSFFRRGMQDLFLALEVRSSADAWISVASAPDASSATSPRIFLSANETRNVFVSPGDKLAWVVA